MKSMGQIQNIITHRFTYQIVTYGEELTYITHTVQLTVIVFRRG
jgi:hypothetical protein